MILRLLLILIFSFPATGFGKDSEKVWKEKQAKLDFECEKARLIELAPIKRKIYKECMEDKNAEHEACFKLADKYNGGRNNANPRFYDLPECVAAYEYRREYLLNKH